MRKFKKPTPAVAALWKKNFNNDCSKFARSTNLTRDDFHREFADAEGKTWKILGSMEGKDMPCELLETGEIYIWDRWKVSLLIYPEKHKEYDLKTQVVFPSTKKKRATKSKAVEEETKTPRPEQLNLFGEEEIS
jgi:hypothetical protein